MSVDLNATIALFGMAAIVTHKASALFGGERDKELLHLLLNVDDETDDNIVERVSDDSDDDYILEANAAEDEEETIVSAVRQVKIELFQKRKQIQT
ncbi:hypothetical protein FQR65_LT09546 [Abscondita terminalis]|nr:hypothetical protein FQR65_LT09546 [Abscondita terminalis]